MIRPLVKMFISFIYFKNRNLGHFEKRYRESESFIRIYLEKSKKLQVKTVDRQCR